MLEELIKMIATIVIDYVLKTCLSWYQCVILKPGPVNGDNAFL